MKNRIKGWTTQHDYKFEYAGNARAGRTDKGYCLARTNDRCKSRSPTVLIDFKSMPDSPSCTTCLSVNSPPLSRIMANKAGCFRFTVFGFFLNEADLMIRSRSERSSERKRIRANEYVTYVSVGNGNCNCNTSVVLSKKSELQYFALLDFVERRALAGMDGRR